MTSHPEFRMGTAVPTHPDRFNELALYDVRWVGRHMVSAFLTLADDVKRSEGLLNMSVGLIPRGSGFGSDAHRAMASFSAARRRGEPQHGVADKMRSVCARLETPRKRCFSESRATTRSGAADGHAIWIRTVSRLSSCGPRRSSPRCGQNRITLGDKRDRLGRNRIALDYQWSKDDRDNIQRSIDIFSGLVDHVGLGQFTASESIQEGPVRPRQEGFHRPWVEPGCMSTRTLAWSTRTA